MTGLMSSRRSASALGALLIALSSGAHAQAPVGGAAAPPVAGEGGGQVPHEVGASQLSKLPKQTKFVEAEYPADAAAKGIDADVILLLDIGADGKVTQVGIAEPSSTPGVGFEEAAVAAAMGFEFEPAEQNGVKIAVQLSYRYKFRLKPKEPPAPPPPGAPAAPAAPHVPVENFKGELLERGTRTPLAGVLVTVFRQDAEGAPLGFEATSDAQGRFVFRDLEPGTWKVSVEAPGYYPFKTSEEIAAREVVDASYYVERGSYNPYDVTVSAVRPRKEVSRTQLAATEIEIVPGTAGDPLNVVQNFAGVGRPAFANAGELIVRGSSPEDSRIFVDGAEVPILFHFGAVRGVLPAGLYDSIDFYPGNFSPEFGRATGGIVDVRVKRLEPKRLGGYLDVSVLDTGLFIQAPLGDKGGISLSGRRSYIGDLVTAAVPDDADVSVVSAPVYYDFQLLANYRPTSAHDLRALVFGSDDRLELLFQDPANFDPKLTSRNAEGSTSFYRSQLTWRFTPSPSFENTLFVSQGRNWLDFEFGQLAFHQRIYTSQVRDTVRHTFDKHFALSYGLDLLYAQGEVTARLPPRPQEGEPPSAGPDLDKLLYTQDTDSFLSPAVFATLEFSPIDGLLLLPGVRADYFDIVDQWVVQPRLTARYTVVPKFTLKGGVGLFAKAPEFDEADENFGNPDLTAERAIHYSLGFEYKPERHLLFDITGFYKDMLDLVSPTDRVVQDAGGAPRPLRLDNGGEGRAYGAELTIRHEFHNNFTGWLVYTLSRAERRDTDATEDRLFDFDQTHILTLIGSYSLPRNWQFGFRFRVVSGNPRTPVIGAIFDATGDRYSPVYGATNSARNAIFHQLDVRVDKRWIFDDFILTAYLDIQNIYAQPNEEGRSYRFDYAQSQRQTGLPILPILGLRAEL